MNKIKTGTAWNFRPCVAAAYAILACPALAAEPLEMQLHWLDVRGARDIEHGRYQQGVERLEARLDAGHHAPWVRVPILIDLCVGYAMLSRLDEAAQACDEAFASGWYTSIVLNNRGVLNIVRGRYEAAIHDFQAISHGVNRSQVALDNLERAQERFAALRGREPQDLSALDTLTVNDIRTTPAGE